MRNLTIRREKHFVASLGTMKVYIEDPTANDLTINGVSCRKLGTLKNGEEKTFTIAEEAAKVFVIADKLSKGFCSEYYPLPAGQEDVRLSGKNCFNPATGNAFRFDGVTDEAVLKHRKKGVRIGILVLIIAAIVGFGIGFLATSDLLVPSGEPKTFSAKGMQITLTDEFSKQTAAGYTAGFGSKDVAVLVLKEDFTLQEGFGHAVLDAENPLCSFGLDNHEPSSRVDTLLDRYAGHIVRRGGGFDYREPGIHLSQTGRTGFVVNNRAHTCFDILTFACIADATEQSNFALFLTAPEAHRNGGIQPMLGR